MKRCRTCGQFSLLKVIGGLKEGKLKEHTCTNQSCIAFHAGVFQ